ncbi:MAG TPA: hypothetical protein VNA19_06385 [Pyrinomonadaceae bacterium]|jgi:hypothetical protein|nr:hypothetical protein [Pyrinomonadaceae bacterium]
MKQHPENPPTNQLAAGLSEADLSAAVEKSGYPLQTIVADLLRSKQWGVQEEWSYIDRDTKELRTIDILAEKHLFDFKQGQPRVRPALDLLIECKQSVMPYVFFLSPTKPLLFDFPSIAGLAKHSVTITTDDDPSSWTLSILHALGLERHSFFQIPEYCTTFSKCVRKGSEVVLSGNESFHGLIMPALKSLHHFQVAQMPPETAWYFDAHLAIAIGVLDAPMVNVSPSASSSDLTLVPWVRVLRHEYLENLERWDRSKLFALDVVHKDFLEEYLEKHLLPFAETFGELVIKHQHILATGEAFVSGMGKDSWDNIEPRLERRKLIAKVSRSKALGKNIFRLITRQKTLDD